VNAGDWLARESSGDAALALIGAPISRASISPSEAWSTPPAFRQALHRFPTWNAARDTDLESLAIRDLGDVEGDREDADAGRAHGRIETAVRRAYADQEMVVVVGGDNSLTRPAFHGAEAARPDLAWGLLTLDAHHDCRPLDDGPRNGTPVRELIEAGLPGRRVAQVGIHPWGNAADVARWAIDQGVHVYALEQVRGLGIGPVLVSAVGNLVAGGAQAIWVDFDLDVLDRVYAPACPASLPGGLDPTDLAAAAFHMGRHPAVLGADLTEVDARADLNGVTVRTMAAVFLDFCCGVAERLQNTPP
jgi:formiminoglutamase